MKNILVVDDEQDFLDSFAERIALKGMNSIPAVSGEEALVLAKDQHIDLAIVDYKMPGIDGLVTISKLKDMQPGLQTVLLTGHGSEKLRQASAALNSGYMQKGNLGPIWDILNKVKNDYGMVVLLPGMGQAAEQAAIPQMHEERRVEEHPGPQARLIGDTPSVRHLKEEIARAADLESPVLITGEEGAGKELCARMIHESSHRRNARFACLDCGFLDPETIAAEIFGVEPTSEDEGRPGLLETCVGGTLLLNNLSGAPISVQERLQVSLKSNRAARLGGGSPMHLAVRIIAAVNCGPGQALKNEAPYRELMKEFIISMHVPPLRERIEDIPPLAAYFADSYAREYGKPQINISPEVFELFKAHRFPGNVRELESVIERAVIVCDGYTIEPGHLPARFQEKNPVERLVGSDYVTLAELEDRYIREVLKSTGGNKSEAARILGINRASLWRKLKKFDE